MTICHFKAIQSMGEKIKYTKKQLSMYYELSYEILDSKIKDGRNSFPNNVGNLLRRMFLSTCNKFYIYFLLDKNTVVYVGQTKDIISRIQSHMYSDKVFDDIFCVDAFSDLDRRLNQEAWFIQKLKPKYNINEPVFLGKSRSRKHTIEVFAEMKRKRKVEKTEAERVVKIRKLWGNLQNTIEATPEEEKVLFLKRFNGL